MRNRPFTLPPPKSDIIAGSDDLGNLKRKFAGKTLFRDNLYYLETGNVAVLDKINNSWFLEELFTYSQTNNDPNLIPALKKISDTVKYDESIRQRASEIAEVIEEQYVNAKDKEKVPSLRTEAEKAYVARKMLAGVRYPQTTDILRLLREKSPELKKLALFLIGKFNMTDMIQEVCECLNSPGIETDAFLVLHSFGNHAGNELNRFYLITSGNLSTSKAILRIYAKSCPRDNIPFLIERLWSNSRQLKEIALNALINCGYRATKDDAERLNKLIFETFSLLAKLTSGKVCLNETSDSSVYREMDKEYNRWKDYLLNLLFLTYGNEVPVNNRKNHFEKEENTVRYFPELADIIFGNSQAGVAGNVDATVDKKRLKRMQRFFPGEIPRYKELLEDIINCDYNIISIWTKACTLRKMAKIEDDTMGESVVALLFSPEELLMQEAARLIARSGMELYRAASERIPESARIKLDEIVSGETDENELIYGKVKFLASCFAGIYEDELLFIAEKLIYIKKGQENVSLNPEGGIIWSFVPDKPDPAVLVIHENSVLLRRVTEKLNKSSFCYILQLNVVEEFGFEFPESSFRILKYIDEKEE